MQIVNELEDVPNIHSHQQRVAECLEILHGTPYEKVVVSVLRNTQSNIFQFVLDAVKEIIDKVFMYVFSKRFKLNRRCIQLKTKYSPP
jgi:hypothetical protein